MGTFYHKIWSSTWRQQLILIALSLLVAAIAAAPLKLQQDIINHLVTNQDVHKLVIFCLIYLAVLTVSAALKGLQAFYTQRLGESTVQRMRKRLYEQSVRQEEGEPVDKGTLVNMLSAEAEGVGTFVGAAISAPVMQIGIMLSVIGFIASSQPELGVIAVAVILPQLIIVLVVQARINATVKERTQRLRRACNVVSASDLEAINEEVVAEFDAIYHVRIRNFTLKLSSKFLQNVCNGIGNAAILFIGGWLVMQGKSDTGTVVASLSGLARLNGPWRELVAIYRSASAMNVNFWMIIRQFPTLVPSAK